MDKNNKKEDKPKAALKETAVAPRPSRDSNKVTGKVEAPKKVEAKPRPEFIPPKARDTKEDKCCKSCDCVKLSKAEMKGLLSHLPAWSERENVMSAKDKLLKALK